MLIDIYHHASSFYLAQGGPDFSHIGPDARGVPKAGVITTIAQVILYFGLGILFVVLIAGVVTWGAGHLVGGMHVSQAAKANIIRAGFAGIVLTASGGIWTWIVSVN